MGADTKSAQSRAMQTRASASLVDHQPNTRAKGRTLMSSSDRRWRGISAELRSHPAGERLGDVIAATEVAVMIKGTTIVTRQAEGIRQHVLCSLGTIGLTPAGISEDFKHVAKDIDEMLHIQFSPSYFASIVSRASASCEPPVLRYDAGFRDPLIECIAAEILGELRFETSCGDLLIETLADALAVRLLNNFSSLGAPSGRGSNPSKGLDARRLQRVLDYIDVNLPNEITIDELAAAASLSRFHFSRMFKATTGQSPNRFIGQRRLELAKSHLANGSPISQVAFDCGFSSESNFARSFRRATGFTPGRYRESIRAMRSTL
jgi:AraC family transcriptional regulator